MFTEEPHHIIAIGASAGGMEEINSFFDHTPVDGVSYVIVQHLSSDFKSKMVQLLGRHSKLIVEEATNGMLVKSNQVYLIPSDKFMTISEDKLFLTEKELVKGPHLTVNTFFNSLAEDCGTKAIGVILSGLGSDGTEGTKAIKKAGGMVIARNPDTSEFSSMPAHAIATGLVDFVLEPNEMPKVIEDYVKREIELATENKDDEKYIVIINKLINEQLPLDFSNYKQSTILRRIKRRAASHNFNDLEAYIEFLKKEPNEVEALTKDFLISVTSFFRDKEAFEVIKNEVLPEIIENLSFGEELRIWVAGCATGEEAYSIAILIAEQLTENKKNIIVKIFATDLDTSALKQASKGIYDVDITKTVSAELLEKYFIKEENSFRVKQEIRKMVIFAQHDLVKNPPYCNIHLISCRNVLIYMAPVLQKKIFGLLMFGLQKNGYLFLGSSENPMAIISKLAEVNRKWKIYKNVEEKRSVNFDAFLMPESLSLKSSHSSSLPEDKYKGPNNNFSEAAITSLANDLDYLVIYIDENKQVIKSFGDTTKFLLQKHFNVNLPELLPKPLAVALNTLSTKALKNNEKSTLTHIEVNRGQFVAKVSLSVIPVTIKKAEPKVLMVIFHEEKLEKTAHVSPAFNEKKYLDEYTENLEEEINDLKDKLQSAYEKLDSTNENMQSFNEELLSANEEMQSTNEEMQSVNEELHTINAEYQLKNKELLELNDDLNNYFRSNINGQVFVNNDLELIKFSPGAVKQINLLESDIGRPLSNISTNIKFETITEDIKQVISEGCIKTKEIETNNGKWYQIMTMPYIQLSDNKRNGAIITFNDITELKKAQLELDKKNTSLKTINSDLENFVHVASHDLLAPLGNIEGSIDLMNEVKLTDPQLNTVLKIINNSVKKFIVLIKDIAVIGKLENDNGIGNLELVDIDETLYNIEWSLEDKIKASGAIIKRELGVKHIQFSKRNFRSILFNLISNGIKFKRDEAPLIIIKTIKDGENMILTIQDNGKGMPKDSLDKIFDIYGRLHQDVEGKGVGLYLAKKIINAANGSIIVESQPGIGSKFIIHFKFFHEIEVKTNLNQAEMQR